MIEREIHEIIKDPRRVALLADEFRRGRDLGDLLDLLNADNKEIVGIGAWIAGEVNVDPAKAQRIIPRLYQLLDHGEPSVRFHAISAIFPFLDMSIAAERQMLVRLSCDPDEGVRAVAQAALSRIHE